MTETQTPDITPEDDNVVEMQPPQEEAQPEINPLEVEIADLKDQLAKTKDQALRAVAESENVRKRVEKERTDLIKYGAKNLAQDLLEVADNFSRALSTKPDDAALKNYTSGVEMIEKQLLDVFSKHGLQAILPEGEAFNPNLHQAMMEQDAPDKVPGTVLSVLQVGWMLHDRLLRPARVVVAKGGSMGNEGVDTLA